MEFRPKDFRHIKEKEIKPEHLIPIVPVLIIILIYVLLVITELDSYISTKYEIKGFEFIRPIPSGISLTTDGNLTLKFINIWLARVTILNITAANNESGRCFIPLKEHIIYKDTAHPLPFIIPGWGKFEVKAFACAPNPDEYAIKPGDGFQVNITSKYVIGEVFGIEGMDDIIMRILLRGLTIHEESGKIRGRYK